MVTGTMRKSNLFMPVLRALSQFDDPAFRDVMLRSLAWSAAGFAAVFAGSIWAIHHLLDWHGWIGWVIDIIASAGASLLAFWLFLPVAAVIGTLYLERIAAAVERRFYPWLPPPVGAPLLEQVWDGVAVGLNVLLLNVVALILALLLPGIGLVLGWMIASYAIGRGLFVAVAMRRMSRDAAEYIYQSKRISVLTQGALIAFAAYIPVLNLLIPIIGTAAMVHVLDSALASAEIPRH
jgi:CysZ protein